MPPVKKQALHTAAITFAKRKFQEQFNEQNTVSTIVHRIHFDDNHPFAIGTEFLMKAKWFELIEQMCSTNPIHTTFIRELYVWHIVQTQDIIGKYKFLHETDFSQPDSVWLTAPVLVATNRERYTITPI